MNAESKDYFSASPKSTRAGDCSNHSRPASHDKNNHGKYSTRAGDCGGNSRPASYGQNSHGEYSPVSNTQATPSRRSAHIALRLQQLQEERAIQQREWQAEMKAIEQERIALKAKYDLLEQELALRRKSGKYNHDVSGGVIAVKQDTVLGDQTSSPDQKKTNLNGPIATLKKQTPVDQPVETRKQSVQLIQKDVSGDLRKTSGVQLRIIRAYSKCIQKGRNLTINSSSIDDVNDETADGDFGSTKQIATVDTATATYLRAREPDVKGERFQCVMDRCREVHRINNKTREMLRVFVRKKFTSPTIQLCIFNKHLFTNIFHPSGYASLNTDEFWKQQITNTCQTIKSRMKLFSIRLSTHTGQVSNARYSTMHSIEVSIVFADFRSTIFWLKLNINKPIGFVNVSKLFVCHRMSHNSFENKKRKFVVCSKCVDFVDSVCFPMDIHHALLQSNRTRHLGNGLDSDVVNYKMVFDELHTHLRIDIHNKDYILRKLDTFLLFNNSAVDVWCYLLAERGSGMAKAHICNMTDESVGQMSSVSVWSSVKLQFEIGGNRGKDIGETVVPQRKARCNQSISFIKNSQNLPEGEERDSREEEQGTLPPVPMQPEDPPGPSQNMGPGDPNLMPGEPPPPPGQENLNGLQRAIDSMEETRYSQLLVLRATSKQQNLNSSQLHQLRSQLMAYLLLACQRLGGSPPQYSTLPAIPYPGGQQGGPSPQPGMQQQQPPQPGPPQGPPDILPGKFGSLEPGKPAAGRMPPRHQSPVAGMTIGGQQPPSQQQMVPIQTKRPSSQGPAGAGPRTAAQAPAIQLNQKQKRVTTVAKSVGLDPIIILEERENRMPARIALRMEDCRIQTQIELRAVRVLNILRQLRLEIVQCTTETAVNVKTYEHTKRQGLCEARATEKLEKQQKLKAERKHMESGDIHLDMDCEMHDCYVTVGEIAFGKTIAGDAAPFLRDLYYLLQNHHGWEYVISEDEDYVVVDDEDLDEKEKKKVSQGNPQKYVCFELVERIPSIIVLT
ncbi:uncharacterized protein LOC134290091 [Aedes albopictus]|uniref:Uncharacterized protein n=1 Tax=Aedes albopictus TaxID=7160 RepID=A0ABM1YRL5_AEDAL